MTDTRVAVLVGSVRADSLNRRIAEVLRDQAPEGVVLDIVEDLAALPFYDDELDAQATPAVATALRERIAGADAVLAVTPEYNGSIPAVLKNGIDWLSRPYAAGAIKGKPFGVIGATPTPYGGKWAHEHTVHAAGIAGAAVVDGAIVSQSALEVDVLSDPEVLGRFRAVIESLVTAQVAAA